MPWSSPATIREMSTRAEALGFHSVWVADHIVVPVGVHTPDTQGDSSPMEESDTFFEPLITLSYLAAQTSSIRLGTSILVAPIRSPVYTAKLVATLDRLSGGRVILGIGVGWLRDEFIAMGNDNFSSRGQAFAEHVAIYRALWSDEVASYSGKLHHLPPVRSGPKPTQRGGPPIWIGGNSAQAIRRVAQLGDGWHPVNLSAPEVGTRIELLKEELSKAGRLLAEIEICPRVEVGIDISPELKQRNSLFGSVPQVAAQLKAYEAVGCTALVIDPAPLDSPQLRLVTVERLAWEVLPLL